MLETEKEKNVKLKEVFKTTQEKYEVQVKELDSSLKQVKVEYDAKTKQFDELLTYSEKAMGELTVAVKAEQAKTGGEPQDDSQLLAKIESNLQAHEQKIVGLGETFKTVKEKYDSSQTDIDGKLAEKDEQMNQCNTPISYL